MSRLIWDAIGERFYETGVSNGVLYIPNAQGNYTEGHAWNGLTGVTASPSGAESNKQFADNIEYLNLISAEQFGGTIEAFYSPKAFDQCDGSASPAPGIAVGQQGRRSFGFSYQTLVGNDIDGQDHAYKIHVIYGAQASPSERANVTVNDSPEAVTLSWEFQTTPVAITPEIIVNGRALRPTSTLTFDSRDFSAAKMQDLKNVLWGTDSQDPRLPQPYELITMMTQDLAEVTPEDPEYANGVVLIPDTPGVVYYVNGVVAKDEVNISAPTLVSALPGPGYKFPNIVQTHWVFKP